MTRTFTQSTMASKTVPRIARRIATATEPTRRDALAKQNGENAQNAAVASDKEAPRVVEVMTRRVYPMVDARLVHA